MNKPLENPVDDTFNYGESFQTELDVKIIKKEVVLYDGTKIKIARGKHERVKMEFWAYMEKNGRCI